MLSHWARLRPDHHGHQYDPPPPPSPPSPLESKFDIYFLLVLILTMVILLGNDGVVQGKPYWAPGAGSTYTQTVAF